MAANPPFGLLDEGGALSKRMIILAFPKTFYGREDVTLLDRILIDLPGIVALALDALGTLDARGRFQEPAAAADERHAAALLETPALGFFEDMCELGPDFEVPKEQLYACYKQWCESNGGRPVHMNIFGGVAKQQGITSAQSRAGGKRTRAFHGVKIVDQGGLRVVNAGE